MENIMSLTLYSHPLASFCHKVLIALYEAGTPFKTELVDFGAPGEHAKYLDLWPIGKMPLLRDDARNETIPETSIIIDYLDHHYPGPSKMLPDEPDAALQVKLWDRFFDLYVHDPMQKIVVDTLRPEESRDAFGINEAREKLNIAYGMLQSQLAGKQWATGDKFTMADCAAAPALFYAGIVEPFSATFPAIDAYFERLIVRPSIDRVLKEARPWFQYFPYVDLMPARFREND